MAVEKSTEKNQRKPTRALAHPPLAEAMKIPLNPPFSKEEVKVPLFSPPKAEGLGGLFGQNQPLTNKKEI